MLRMAREKLDSGNLRRKANFCSSLESRSAPKANGYAIWARCYGSRFIKPSSSAAIDFGADGVSH
jgi:hypothetical protein